MTEEQRIAEHVGSRIRERRVELGLSLKDVAADLEISLQQLSKRERASDQTNAGQLYMIAQALQVEVGYFYQGIEAQKES